MPLTKRQHPANYYSLQPLTELGVELDAGVAVLHPEIEGCQLVVAGRPVAVRLRVVGVTSDSLRVRFERARIVAWEEGGGHTNVRG